MLEKNGDFMENPLALQGLAQIQNFLTVLIFAIGCSIFLTFLMYIILMLREMKPKTRNDLIVGSFVMFLIVIVMVVGVLIARDEMRVQTINACQLAGINYTLQQWDNGEVNYTKCNITAVNGLA
jgi:hypothetical protein